MLDRYWERMRDGLVVIAAGAALIACTPDTAHWPIFLPPPYNALAPAPPGTTIEPGRPVGLNGRQQEAVIMGVLKWMKDPVSVQFRGIKGVRKTIRTTCSSSCAGVAQALRHLPRVAGSKWRRKAIFRCHRGRPIDSFFRRYRSLRVIFGTSRPLFLPVESI